MPQPPFSRRIVAVLFFFAVYWPIPASAQVATDQPQQPQRRRRQQTQTGKNLNLRPVIGIFAQQTSTITTAGPLAAYDLMVPSSYVNWVGQAGARAIPVLLGRPKSYYQEIFNRTNGLLLPGGSQGILPDEIYTEEGKLLWDMAKEANDSGDYYPIWGTCLGFEELSVLETGNGSVISLDVEATNIALPLNFTPKASSSRLLGSMDPGLVNALSTESITFNSHSHGLLLSEYDQNTALNSFFQVLSTNIATASGGEVFVSTMEAYNYPFYGTQWHPEKNNFEWSLKEGSYSNTPHSPNSVRASIETAMFFIQEARKSSHVFPEEEQNRLIYSAPVLYTGPNWVYDQIYVFDPIGVSGEATTATSSSSVLYSDGQMDELWQVPATLLLKKTIGLVCNLMHIGCL